MNITWCAVGLNGILATSNMNLLHDTRPIRWHLEENIIQQSRSQCAHDQQLSERLIESLNLIPVDDPFVTS